MLRLSLRAQSIVLYIDPHPMSAHPMNAPFFRPDCDHTQQNVGNPHFCWVGYDVDPGPKFVVVDCKRMREYEQCV